MSMRYQAGFLTASYFPLKVPDAPTIGTLSANGSVTFTAPSNVGGGAITGYTVVATDSSSGATFITTGSSSPITITGLTVGNTYTAKVSASNAFGAGPLSAASNSVTYVVQGQQAFTTAGTFSWVAPAGVTSISVVTVGAGGGSSGSATSTAGRGAGGGGLRYGNAISVTAGNSYTVIVGAGGTGGVINSGSGTAGGNSSFNGTDVVANGGGGGQFGSSAGTGGTGSLGAGITGGGGNGGTGSTGAAGFGGGGGGAGGYAGNGGNGRADGTNGDNGSGGGGGGGTSNNSGNAYGLGGGGVGIFGQGNNGAGGISNGKDIWFKVAFKPTSSIGQEQTTVNQAGETVNMKLEGRHDPCVLIRAVPIVEASTALVLYNAFLENKIETK